MGAKYAIIGRDLDSRYFDTFSEAHSFFFKEILVKKLRNGYPIRNIHKDMKNEYPIIKL